MEQAYFTVLLTMEVHDDLLHTTAAEPMRLRSARKCDAFWGEAVVLCILQVYRSCRSVHVPVLGQVEVAQLGAEHGKHDIFEVCVGAIGPLEW